MDHHDMNGEIGMDEDAAHFASVLSPLQEHEEIDSETGDGTMDDEDDGTPPYFEQHRISTGNVSSGAGSQRYGSDYDMQLPDLEDDLSGDEDGDEHEHRALDLKAKRSKDYVYDFPGAPAQGESPAKSLNDYFKTDQEHEEQLNDIRPHGSGQYPVLLTDTPTVWSKGNGSVASIDTKNFDDANKLAPTADSNSYHTYRTTNSVPQPPAYGRETSMSAFSAVSSNPDDMSLANPGSISGDYHTSVTFGDIADTAESVGTYQSKTSLSSKSPGSAMRSKQRWSRHTNSSTFNNSGATLNNGFQGNVDEIIREGPNKTSLHGINLSRTSSASLEDYKDDSTGGGIEAAPADKNADVEPETDVNDISSHEGDTDDVRPIFFGNLRVPLWFSHGPPSIHKLSAAFVRNAPCFWVGCGSKLQRSSTDSAVLTRLNVLCTFWTTAQLGAALYLASILLVLDDEPGILSGFTPHFWNLNGAVFSVGILACCLMLISYRTIRAIRTVDLIGAIRYLWAVLWIIPGEIFFTISLVDYHGVTIVWIHHWWQEGTFAWFRRRFCLEGTENTLCKVPIDGGLLYESEDDWCMDKFNSTSCSEIREDAQQRMNQMMLIFYTCLVVWGAFLLMLMMFMINSLERIITRPIVQKSRETNVPAWLTLPTAGCALVGSIFMYSPSSLLSASSGADNSWIGILYLVAAGLFLVAALAGWFLSAFSIRRSADKRWKNFAVSIFIGVMAANAVILAAIFVASLTFSASLGTNVIDENDRGDVACFVDRSVSCTKCDAAIPRDRCPEWTLDEVTKLLQTQLKQSASLAAIFIVYGISVLRFGIILRQHLSLYQIDYI